MMKQSCVLLLFALAACQPTADDVAVEAASPAEETTQPVAAVRFEGTTLGEPLTLEYLTSVSDILAHPQEFVGQRVLVEGVVTGVCLEKGCWLDIISGEGADTIQIKVDDGVIVFPSDAVGKKVLAEGTVEELQLTQEQAVAAAQHKAEEQKTTFDPATVTGPVTKYRIRGLGVLIAT